MTPPCARRAFNQFPTESDQKSRQFSPYSRDNGECEHQSRREGPSFFNLQCKELTMRERGHTMSANSLFGCRSRPWCCWWSPPGIGWWYPGLFVSTACKYFVSSLSKNISKFVLFVERVVGIGDVPQTRNCSQPRVRHLGTPVTFCWRTF